LQIKRILIICVDLFSRSLSLRITATYPDLSGVFCG
jgi:hypothetical protein